MTAREIIKRLKAAGWDKVRSEGSHAHFKHPEKPGRVTVPVHGGDVDLRTLISIEKQSGLDLRKRK